MKRQLQGIGIILFSIMLILGFDTAGIKYVFDLSRYWSHIFMVIGAFGFIWMFTKDKEGKQ